MSESPQASATPATGTVDENLEEPLKDLVQRADLTEVRYTRWQAELLVDEPGDVGAIELRIANSLRTRGAYFDTKFEVDVPVRSEDEKDLAKIQMAIVASFKVADGDLPERAVLSEFVRRVAYFVVMPFIREGLHSLSTRVGLEPITIGLLQQGTSTPVTAWTRRRHRDQLGESDSPG